MRLKIELPPTWRQEENPKGPATFFRDGSTSAFQVSWAEYCGGELPQATPEGLTEMAIDVGQNNGFGELVESSADTCRYGHFGTAVFCSTEYPRIQIWFVSDGRDFIMATHICDSLPHADEIDEAQRIAMSLVLGPDHPQSNGSSVIE